MRIAVTVLCLASLPGCIQESSDDYWSGGGGGGWGSGWGGGGGSAGFGCQSDDACGSLTCTRTGECLPAAQVRAVVTDWTVQGEPASETSCARAPRLSITFSSGAGEQFGYTPVPCKAGKFTVDKLPLRFTSVQLAREGDRSGGAYGTFDSDGRALLDLRY
jgi:hypothetical protein